MPGVRARVQVPAREEIPGQLPGYPDQRHPARPAGYEPPVRKEVGVSHAGCRAASASMVNTKVAVPKVSRAKETSSPMRSSDLRKKMRSATTVHTAAKR